MKKLIAEAVYSQIIDLLKENRYFHKYNIEEMEYVAKSHLLQIELKEDFNIDLQKSGAESFALGYIVVDEYRSIVLHDKGGVIQNEDNGRRTDNERLLELCFSRGPYIFGDDYPKNFFETFFNELKTFKPKYISTSDNTLFFAMENAGVVFNEFPNILKKYQDLNVIDKKLRRIKELESELISLKTEYHRYYG